MKGNEYARLRAFLAVAEQGSFARAAGELRLAPSTLSQMIRDLESQLDVQLFRRTTRSVALTEPGERLLAGLRPALNMVDDALSNVHGGNGRPAGKLRLHIPHLALEQYLLPLLGEFRDRYPLIELEICASNAVVSLAQEGFDVGVRLGEFLEPNVVAMPLGGRVRQLPVASPAYLARHGVPREPGELASHRCINWRWQRPGGKGLYDWEFEKDGRKVTVSVNGPLTVSHRHIALAAAIQGVGIALWNDRIVQPFIEKGELVALLEDWSPSFPGWYIYYLKTPSTPAAITALVGFLRDRAPEMAARPPAVTFGFP